MGGATTACAANTPTARLSCGTGPRSRASSSSTTFSQSTSRPRRLATRVRPTRGREFHRPAQRPADRTALSQPCYPDKLCVKFDTRRGCKFADKCAFAHGLDDLRPSLEERRSASDYFQYSALVRAEREPPSLSQSPGASTTTRTAAASTPVASTCTSQSLPMSATSTTARRCARPLPASAFVRRRSTPQPPTLRPAWRPSLATRTTSHRRPLRPVPLSLS
jgi:hypothetical protein